MAHSTLVDPNLVTCDFPGCDRAVDPAYALMLGSYRQAGRVMLSFCSRSCRSRWIVDFEHRPTTDREVGDHGALPA